jgi:small subunit ribosomal protein S8
MSQDVTADALNMVMNAKKAGKPSVSTHRYSKVLLGVLAIAKIRGHIKDYKVDKKILTIEINKLNNCQAIKPRYTIKVQDINKYTKRFLPAKNIGTVIISTSQGLMTHQVAQEKNLGGSLIAYIY